jgi:hypothetical protein
MRAALKILDIKTIREIHGYWSVDDYMNLLEEFNYSEARDSPPSELRELIEMAITDFEPHEAAEILLRYKLSGKLNEGQIKNLSHEMLEDNESEEYPDISLHYPMFCINQLLYTSYNGVFQNGKATKMEFELSLRETANTTVTKEIVLMAIGNLLDDNSLVKRLFEDQFNGIEPFPDAEKLLWELQSKGQNTYALITSDYWINQEDLIEEEFIGLLNLFEE